MNGYSSFNRRGYGIPEGEILSAVRSHRFLAAPYVAARERQCGWQADIEQDWLLKQSGLTSSATGALVTIGRRTIGAALVRFGQRIQGASSAGHTPDTAGSPSTVSIAG